MSFYTKFQDVEVTVTSSTTSILQSSDPILIFSAQQKRASQATVGSISVAGLIATAATTSTTGTNIVPQGVSTINSTTAIALSGTSAVWTLSDPPSVGLCKTLFNLTTTTSTGVIVGFAAATGISTDVATGTISTVQFTAYGAYFELQALSTSQWLVIGRSAAGAKSS